MADGSGILTECVSDDFLRDFEERYNTERDQLQGDPTADTTFQYAWCLVRSRVKNDVKKGILMLEELLEHNTGEDSLRLRRDYLYYLAVGHGRNKDYNEGLKYVKLLLQSEPGNKQAQSLEKEMRKAMDSDALKGAAIAAGVIAGAGALIGLGMAIFKNK